MLIEFEGKKNLKTVGLYIAFLVITTVTGIPLFVEQVITDIRLPYSAAKDMAAYINENVPKGETILIDASIIGQSLIPYLDKSYSLYDMSYNQYSKCAKSMAYEENKVNEGIDKALKSHDKYLIISSMSLGLNNLMPIHGSFICIEDECYTLYYIP